MRPALLAIVLALAVLAGCQDPPVPGRVARVFPSPAASVASPRPSPASWPSPEASPVRSPTWRPGLLVPLYVEAADPAWDRLIALKRAHPRLPVTAIVNPASGATRVQNPAFAAAVTRLAASGVVCLGYVATGEGARPVDAMELELDRWKRWYPATQGVFFDEMATGADADAYYGQLAASAHRYGFTPLLANPGTRPAERLFDAVDAVVVYEDAGMPASDLALPSTAARRGMLAHGVASLDVAALRDAAGRYAYLYVTDDGMPNPWDSLSSHAQAMADLLDP